MSVNSKTKGEAESMKIKPLRDRVLVQPDKEADLVKKGGIIIPDAAKEKPQEGVVIAVGPGKRDKDGKIVPMEVKKGDKVLMPKYGGSDIKIDDKEYKIISEEDIVAIIE